MARLIIRRSLPTMVWSQLTEAGAFRTGTTGQLSVRTDPWNRIYFHGTDAGGIYSTALFFATVSGGTITFTKLAGSGGASGSCANYPNSSSGNWNNGDGSAIQPWLADRHPETMNAIDITRNKLMQYSGLACGNPASGDGLYYRDLWQVNLHETIASITMQKRTITAPSIHFSASMAYSPVYDLFLLHGQSGGGSGGFPRSYIYCPTNAGSLSAPQIAAGGVADDFVQTHGIEANTPPGSGFCNIEWDAAVPTRFLMFRMVGQTNPWPSQVWAYGIESQAWSELSVVNPPSNILSGGHPKQTVTRITSGRWLNKFHFRSSPDANGAGGDDFLFNPFNHTYYPLISTGDEPPGIQFETFLPTAGADGSIITYAGGTGWFKGELQQ